MMFNINKVAALAWIIAAAPFCSVFDICAREIFNPDLVELDNPDAGKADLSNFETGSQAPGRYRVDIILDDRLVDTQEIEFKTSPEGHLEPCLSVEQLKLWGVRTDDFPALSVPGETCARLAAIPQASADFQFASQQLAISVPQAALSMQARGYVPPALWDEGISAAMLNYSLSGAVQHAKTGDSSSAPYANLRPGINLGPWRLRNYSTWARDAQGRAKWDSIYTYAQRAVIPLRAQLALGDSSSPAEVFDSLPFRGAQLASDDDMLPDSMKGYAPVVRGIARTNAQVIIRQNGYQIYQSYVAPGAFEITDMYPTGGAGDLEVTLKEADGSEQHFTVPFASLPVLQREGRLKYAVTLGRYRAWDAGADNPLFGQLTGIYGLPFGLTLYGGVQSTRQYRSLALGAGKNMGDVGALSVDVTQAQATPRGMAEANGYSLRARYSKNFASTGTNMAIAGYRYSTRDYYDMQEVLDSGGSTGGMNAQRRNRAEITMSQALGSKAGSMMVSAVREDYWMAAQATTSLSVAYNNFWHEISYGLTYSRNQSGSGGSRSSDRIWSFTLSVPLGRVLPQSWSNTSVTASRQSGTTYNTGINGTALENNALSWNLQQGYDARGVGYTGNLNADYKGTYGALSAGYNYDRQSDRLTYGLQGGIVAHADGVTFSQPLAETNTLVKAPGAAGIGIQNQAGAKTDRRGYTLVSNMMPYRKNEVSLLTESLPDDVELEQTAKTVIPTRGAIVRADYHASVGQRMLMTLTQQNGKPVPFGAVVTADSPPHSAFIVDDEGQVYLVGLQPQGMLTVKWGEGDRQRCRVKYGVNSQMTAGNISRASVVCLPAA